MEYSYAAINFLQCALKCYPQAQCRAAYPKCENSICFCVLCLGVEIIDFSVVDEKLFLEGRVMAKNATMSPDQKETIPGGLSVGQIIVAKVVMTSGITFSKCNLPNGDVTLSVSIWIRSRFIVSNSKINGHWARGEINTSF